MRGFLVSLLLNAAFGSGVPNFFQPSGWFARSRPPSAELAAGVDADLVLANRKRYRLGVGLFCFGLLIIVLGAGSHVEPRRPGDCAVGRVCIFGDRLRGPRMGSSGAILAG